MWLFIKGDFLLYYCGLDIIMCVDDIVFLGLKFFL